MIQFSGYTYERVGYMSDGVPPKYLNMGRVYFGSSPIGVDFIEGEIKEYECETYGALDGQESNEIITNMVLKNILQIQFKDGRVIKASKLCGLTEMTPMRF